MKEEGRDRNGRHVIEIGNAVLIHSD